MLPSYFDASSMGLIWALPFAFFLLSLAVGPLYFHKEWEKYDIFVVFSVVFIILASLASKFGLQPTFSSLKHTMLDEYVPFILMMSSLYVVSSGIHITTKGTLTPLHNVIFLFIASLSASVIGTTGASMLLIRPFLRLNHDRRHKAYLVIFFIFLVSNIGGSLTPVGDPPLFMGFLNGIDFFWPLKRMAHPFLLVSLLVLIVFYFFDKKHFKDRHLENTEQQEIEKFAIYGAHNFLFVALILFSIILSGMDMEKYQNIRNIALIAITILSFITTKKNVYHMNRFSLLPLREVALVFLAIFVTLIPITAMLHGGGEGAFAEMIRYANPKGIPDPLKYFFISGILSGFLDNAPTYLLFFHLAGGDSLSLMGAQAKTLLAISSGSVFFGALSYIGNAPNLMVKAIAESAHIKIPSFGGYLVWSFCILFPILCVFGLFFFR